MINKISFVKNKWLRWLACLPYTVLILFFWFICLVIMVLIELCAMFEQLVKNVQEEGRSISEIFLTAIKRAWSGDTRPIKVNFLER